MGTSNMTSSSASSTNVLEFVNAMNEFWANVGVHELQKRKGSSLPLTVEKRIFA